MSVKKNLIESNTIMVQGVEYKNLGEIKIIL